MIDVQAVSGGPGQPLRHVLGRQQTCATSHGELITKVTQSERDAAGQEEDAAAMQHLVRNLRPASRWALEVALKALATDGVAGTLVIQIPRQRADRVDVSFVAGVTDLIQRF